MLKNMKFSANLPWATIFERDSDNQLQNWHNSKLNELISSLLYFWETL